MANRTRKSLVSSSQMEYAKHGKQITCGCKRLAPLVTSWTNENPGRRFYGCCNFKFGGCHFFKWYNDQFPPRANELLICLRDNERKLARQVGFLEKENELLKSQLLSLGISFDEINSSNGNQRLGVDSSESNVVDNGVTTNHVVDDVLVQMVRKLKIEVQQLENKRKKMKQQASSSKKANRTYKLSLVVLVLSVEMIWLYFNCKFKCNDTCVMKLQ